MTAYSEDYTIGRLCEHNHRQYCERHGYSYVSEVAPYQEMLALVQPRQFLGWFKVLMLRRMLCEAEQRQRLESGGVEWLVWIDADAVFVDLSKPLLEILSQRSQGRELVIGEDSSTCCLVNTGVVAVRVCDWCAALWAQVWEQRRFFSTYFYEQSALLKCLKLRHEGLDLVSPFHSFIPGGPGEAVKLFPHTCVLPMAAWNSNVDEEGAPGCCEYVFHAIGRANKLGLLTEALRRRGLDKGGLPVIEHFHIIRGPCGGPPSQWALEQSLLWTTNTRGGAALATGVGADGAEGVGQDDKETGAAASGTGIG